MDFMISGFLSDLSDEFKKENSEKYREFFEICRDLNIYSHQVLKQITSPTLPEGTDKIIAICLLLRGLCSFAASIKLMELGLCTDAGNNIRNMLET
ncbi:MAG: hypothetical protein M3Q07_20520, partial [Pseudobdellovibrionaceae bacterium]|nr:hypothetical protein [Pseudobdellovibrionaceae bacterium]